MGQEGGAGGSEGGVWCQGSGGSSLKVWRKELKGHERGDWAYGSGRRSLGVSRKRLVVKRVESWVRTKRLGGQERGACG